MNCWICGAEPVEVHSTITPPCDEPVITYIRWPHTDTHTHVEQPPTPAQLEQAGHDTLMRILSEAA